MIGVALAAGLLLGAVAVWLGLRGRADAMAERAAALTAELRQRTDQLTSTREELARTDAALDHERSAAKEKLRLLEEAKDELSAAFKALSAEALRTNNSSFIELARATLERFQVQAKDDLDQRRVAVEHLVAPIKESLAKVDGQIQHLERARSEAYGALMGQVRTMAEAQERLRAETGHLVTALRTPAVRGRWGEIQLRRVVEMAGMLAHCDFVEQVTATADGRQLRPDLVVKLPGGKNVVVDAKAPLQAYLEAIEATDDETRTARLSDHARQIRQHMAKLSMKAYWEQFQPAPEFIVMFIPGEAFYSAALEQDPGLIEEGVNQRVLLATPTTLIGVLKAVAYGWHQETVAESARAVSKLGKELHGRLAVLGDHMAKLGAQLDRAVSTYNQTVGSLERRVLPAARRFSELGADGGRDIPILEPVEKSTQAPQALELTEGSVVEPDPGPAEGAAPERDAA
ncbi:MAG TPA: DNA recombination protein RmuC [Gaiellaceae bacterium]